MSIFRVLKLKKGQKQMAKLKISDDWWTAPTQADNGNLIMVTGRRNMDNVRDTGAYCYRMEVTWPYGAGDAAGLPLEQDARLMERATDAINEVLDRDPVAVMTGIYTGDGERNWVFYTRSLHLFQRKFNEALADLPAMPLVFEADEDPQWDEYRQMCEVEVSASDDN